MNSARGNAADQPATQHERYGTGELFTSQDMAGLYAMLPALSKKSPLIRW